MRKQCFGTFSGNNNRRRIAKYEWYYLCAWLGRRQMVQIRKKNKIEINCQKGDILLYIGEMKWYKNVL